MILGIDMIRYEFGNMAPRADPRHGALRLLRPHLDLTCQAARLKSRRQAGNTIAANHTCANRDRVCGLKIGLFLQLLHHPDRHHHNIIDHPPARLPSLILSRQRTYHSLLGAVIACAKLVIQDLLNFFRRLGPFETSATRIRFHKTFLIQDRRNCELVH
jgi:hypothetical protein